MSPFFLLKRQFLFHIILFNTILQKSWIFFKKKLGTPYPEVTEPICRVPSPSFFRALWFIQPVHQCRFEVRSNCFLGYFSWNKYFIITFWGEKQNIVILSFIYMFAVGFPIKMSLRSSFLGADLLGSHRLLLRNPWTFSDQDLYPDFSLLMPAESIPNFESFFRIVQF